MRSILIVEDEELELEFIEAVIHEELQLEDIVITANTGAQAVRQAKKRRPDIIIMDIMLPEMDGLEAIEEIRKFAPDTCISILTAYTDFRYAQRAISLRVFEYMLKPIKPSDFKATLKSVNMKKAAHPRLWQSPSQKMVTMSSNPLWMNPCAISRSILRSGSRCRW